MLEGGVGDDHLNGGLGADLLDCDLDTDEHVDDDADELRGCEVDVG